MERSATAIVANSATEFCSDCVVTKNPLNEGTPKGKKCNLLICSLDCNNLFYFSIFVFYKSFISMSKYILFLLFFTCTIRGQSKINKFSFEFASGYTSPVKPYLSDYNSNFSSFNHINMGFRYMFSEKFGVKIEYVNDRFISNSDESVGTYFNRFGAQIVYNLGKELDLLYISNEKFGLLTHAGLGYTRSTIKKLKVTEQIGSVVIGLSPQYKFNDRTALYLDLSSVYNFKQHFRYDGSLISNDFVPTVGNHYNITLGIILYIGENKMHYDWY